VGYDDGGQLTEFVRRKPYSIVLLDEIEKAHHDIFNILLQIMEEGNLTDTKGRKVNFRDTIIIMTSNIGAKEISKGGRLGFEDVAGMKELSKSELTKDELKKHFNPEFLNRVDEVIYFHPLKREEIIAIVDIMVEDFNARLVDRKIKVSLTQAAKEHMADIGYDEAYGARPLRRIFQRELEDYMATQMLKGAYKNPCMILADAKESKFEFKEEPWVDFQDPSKKSESTDSGKDIDPGAEKSEDMPVLV
ncbi:MAG: AAA family ATPase, partial [Leptospira sp.]|nr:AAA family ATPase [Leptospira sp.]